MKASLVFALPEEAQEHADALRGGELASAIHAFREHTRSWLKHGHEFKTPDEAIEACRKLLEDFYTP